MNYDIRNFLMSDVKTGRIKRSRGSSSDSSATSPFSNTTKPAAKMQKSATSQGPHNATTKHTTAVSGTDAIKDDIKSLRKLVVDIQKEQRAIKASRAGARQSSGFGSRSRRFERNKNVSSPSTCESQYCGEPP